VIEEKKKKRTNSAKRQRYHLNRHIKFSHVCLRALTTELVKKEEDEEEREAKVGGERGG
jgi:hypothetical protein